MKYDTDIPQMDAVTSKHAQLINSNQQNCLHKTKIPLPAEEFDIMSKSDFFDFDDLAKFNIVSLFEKKIIAKLNDIESR